MPSHSAVRILIDYFSVIVIDLLLAGDNALVIAMAVRLLPERQRRMASIFGAVAAVVLRAAITIVAAQLLGVEFLKLVGGVLVIWIAVKVLADASSPKIEERGERHFLQTIWVIVVADITMSLDNILAVAGAAHGSMPLILFGLSVSIPLVIFASNLIAVLMDRYPVILYFGAAILGKVGGEMVFTDRFVTRTLHPSEPVIYSAEALAIAGILIGGRVLSKRKRDRAVPVSKN
jgi:YjbE family integral membrane protein